MRRLLAVPVLLALLAPSASAQKTPSLALAADVGPAIPLGEFADDGAELGWGLGVSATVRLGRLLGVYASFERTTFGVEEDAGYPEDDWTDTGYGVGARLWIPVDPDARFHPWAQLGVGWHDLDKPIAGPEFAEVDTDGIMTVEAGAGVDVAIARQVLFLRPMVRYRRYAFELETAGETTETHVSSLTLGLGIVVVVLPR